MESPGRLSRSDSPFLTDSEKDLDSGAPHAAWKQGLVRVRTGREAWWRHWSVYAVLFVTYSLALLSLPSIWTASSQRFNQFQTYTPALEAVKYHKVKYDGSLGMQTVYTGEPRPELEAAWGRIFKNYNIKFTADELKKLNRTGLELHDGSGHFGQLSAYHHLHCLKILRQIVWYDHYNVSIAKLRGHGDHCIDDIRQSLMCNADLSVVMFDWLPNKRKPWPNFHIDQTCVDWDALDEWASKRSFSIFDQKSLVHPTLGISFPIVNGEIQVHEKMEDGSPILPVWPTDD